MYKKIVITLMVIAVVSMAGTGISYKRPTSYEQCVQNCKHYYRGNQDAINSCIARCR